ncbi:MAG: molecular chaperone DnaJ [Acidimicrobiia bacterium]
MNRDWVDKDFYKMLGVPKDAGADDIKRAYRKLAQENHPDANPGDNNAEERFKQISEAYAVVGNAEKKKEYDEVRRLVESGGFGGFAPGGGAAGTGGFGGFGGQGVRVEDLSDLLGGFGGFGDVFGGRAGGGGAGRQAPRQGANTTTELHLSFTDAVSGVTTSVSVRGESACSRCDGAGSEPGTSARTCPNCRGAGTVAQNQGFFSFASQCPQCHGQGRIIETPCTTCKGSGRTLRTRTIKVKVPPGVKDGSTIRLRGKGAPGSGGGPSGDLLVLIHVDRHDVFGRTGDDLTVTVPVTYSEAALGTRIEVPTLDGSVTLKVPAGTQSGRTFRGRGKGIAGARGKPGDLLVRIEVVVPKKVSRDEKKLLEQLAAYQDDDVRAHLKVTP